MLENKVIIVIGASGGAAKPMLPLFAREGAELTLSARTPEKLENAAGGLPKGKTLIAPGDATSQEDVERIFKETRDQFGKVDGVIISAGTWQRLGIEDSVEDALKSADHLYRSIFLPSFIVGEVAQHFFRKQGHGLIVNISSHAAIRPWLKGNLTYAAMKAASHSFILGLANELKGSRVRAVDLMPAIINTVDTAAFLKTEENKRKAVQPEEIARWIIENFDNPNLPESQLFDSRGIVLD